MSDASARPVLLLQTPITLKESDVPTFGIFPPLGLAYLAAVLEREGIAVCVRDLLAEGQDVRSSAGAGRTRIGLSEEAIRRILLDSNPSVVGISNNFTPFSADCEALAGIVRQTLPEALVIMGGAQASVSAEKILESGNVDLIVVGEAEHTFPELLRRIHKGDQEGARTLAGTVWRMEDGGGIRDNGPCAPIEDLDALPFPAWHLLKMERYIWQKQANFAVAMRYPIGHMITSRGCPYNCIFCSTTKHYKKFRKRSPENVLDEMQLLVEQYGIREIHFHDDCFAGDPERVRALCEGMLERGLDVRWQVSQGINSSRMTPQLLALMKRSGMYRVGFPIESGSQKTLRMIRKPIKIEKALELIEVCNRLGIYCFGCFMIGFPEETPEDVQQSVDFILESGLDYIKVCVVQPLQGSDLYGEYERLGLFEGGARQGSTYNHTEYATRYFSAAELNVMRRDILQRFGKRRITRMLTPSGMGRWLLPKLRGPEDIRYFFKVAWCALFSDTTGR